MPASRSRPTAATIALMIVWFALRALLRLVIYIMIGALILQAVLSWINPYSPLAGAGQSADPARCSIRFAASCR